MRQLRAILTILSCWLSSHAYAMRYNLPVGVTAYSEEIYHLHMLIFWVCVGIGAIVFSVLIYALIMHRKSRGVVAAEFHEHTAVEIIWAVIPFIILVLMAIPATKVLLAMQDNKNAELTIKVTGYQWKWRYEYLDQGIDFYSNLSTTQDQIYNREDKSPNYLLEVDRPIVVPINKKIRFLITANDVIHSWWVPELGAKVDAIPGFVREISVEIKKPGIYRGQCAELCGVNHGFMPIVVIAVEQKDFANWVRQRSAGDLAATAGAAVAAKALPQAELMAEGEKVYSSFCAVCHQRDGSGMPPVFPAIKGSQIVTGPVAKQLQTILYGVPNTAMQAFEHQLTNEQIAAVATYQRNSWGNADQQKWGNAAGGIVQPIEVENLKRKK